MAKIAINGFGRIGRLFFRQALDEPSLEVAAINDLGDLNNLAYLLKHDTVYRDFPGEIKTEIKGNENYLVIDGNKIRVLQEKDPLQLPWGKLGIDIVVESTGVFESFEKAKVHLEAGAKRVVISAPAKDPEGTASGRTILVGINEKETKGAKITSNASCTTNAVALLMTILSKNPQSNFKYCACLHRHPEFDRRAGERERLFAGPGRSPEFGSLNNGRGAGRHSHCQRP
jgi:glyceraldehyde 3-phosphate dehydrogenase